MAEMTRGSLWESRDPRDNGRRVRIVVPPEPWKNNDFVTVENVETGRRSELRELTLTRRYRPAREEGASHGD